MNLSLTLTDRRAKGSRYGSFAQPPELETFERASMSVSGDGPVVAGALRALADEIDPSFALASDFEASA